MTSSGSNQNPDIVEEDSFADAFIIDRTGDASFLFVQDNDTSDVEKKASTSTQTNHHRKHPHNPKKDANLAKKRQRLLTRMLRNHRRAATEQQEAVGATCTHSQKSNYIPPTMFGHDQPSKRPYDGLRIKRPMSSTDIPVVYADSFVTQVTNALLAVETTMHQQQPPPHHAQQQQQAVYDRAGLDLLLILHRIQRLPFTQDALQEILVQFWPTQSWQDLLWLTTKTTVLRPHDQHKVTVEAVDRLEARLVNRFLQPGRFCIVRQKGRKNRYQSRIQWNPQWKKFILLPALSKENTTASATTFTFDPFAKACLQALLAEDNPDQLPPNRSALVQFLRSQQQRALINDGRTAEEIVQDDFVNTVLLPEQLLITDDEEQTSSSSYRWNLPLWHALRRKTIKDFPSHMIACCFIASSFPSDRLQLQRKLGLVVLAAAAAPVVDEMTLLRGFIRQGCLEVAPNGAFAWKDLQLYSPPPPHYAQQQTVVRAHARIVVSNDNRSERDHP